MVGATTLQRGSLSLVVSARRLLPLVKGLALLMRPVAHMLLLKVLQLRHGRRTRVAALLWNSTRKARGVQQGQSRRSGT